jgi:hypothetical protein
MRKILAVLLLLALALPALAQNATNSPAVSSTLDSITPNTSAYVAGNCLGGVRPVSAMVAPSGPGGAVISGVTITDPSHNSAANEAQNIIVFNALPTGTYTDHAACNIAAADQDNVVGIIQVAAANCIQDSTPSTTICDVRNIGLAVNPLVLPVKTSQLWFLPIVTATPTFGTTTLFYTYKSQPN